MAHDVAKSFDSSHFQTIAELLSRQSELLGDRVALLDASGLKIGYRELAQKAFAIAAALQAALPHQAQGQAGARIGIVMPNGIDIAIGLLGACIAGMAVPFNSVSTEAELSVYFSATRLDALLVLEGDRGPSASVAEKLGLPVFRLTQDHRIQGAFPSTDVRLPKLDDIALVLMTSGSTGRPKIVPLSHRNVCRSAHEVATSIQLTGEDRCLLMWEQFHIGGLVDLLLAPLASGGAIITTSGFNAAKFFSLLESHKPTWYQAVPTTLGELVQFAERHGLTVQPNSLRLVRSVAAALSPVLMERVVGLFAVPVIRTFGMTEAGPLITSTPLPPLPQKPGSVGKSCGTRISILKADGTSLGRGEVGEVGIRGENVFSGYEGDPETNQTAFRDGWFLTGDLGYIDAEGDLFLTGRIKQMINRGGEKISPQEVDDVLLTHPSVVDAACFSIPHKTLGEDVAAAVVLRSPVTAAALRSFVAARLAPFKVPQQFAFLDAMPLNPVGKIDKLALARLSAEIAAKEAATAAAPRNPTEALLVEIWKRELYLDKVGIHQDFGALGGDSLSRMRIFLATEAAFGHSLPTEPFIDEGTISGISAALLAKGHELADQTETASEMGERTLLGVEMGTVGYQDSIADLVVALENCPDQVRLAAIRDGVQLYATPTELEAILAATRNVQPGRTATTGTFKRLEVRLRWWLFRQKLARRLRAISQGPAWQREHQTENSILYRSPGDVSGKTLVVGFSGNMRRLMLPTWRMLACMDGNMDLLLVSDPSQSIFLKGAHGLGDTPEAVVQHALDFSARAGYGRLVALGTSGGGPMALFAGSRDGFSRGIAVCPPARQRHPQLGDFFRSFPADAAQKLLIATSSADRDKNAAADIARLVPGITIEMHKDFHTHNIIHEAEMKGTLRSHLSRWIS